MLPDQLLALLVCPTSKQPLVYFPRGEADRDEAEAFLLCPVSQLRYSIEDDVPGLLAEEAVRVTAAIVDQLLARARELGLPVPSPCVGDSLR